MPKSNLRSKNSGRSRSGKQKPGVLLPQELGPNDLVESLPHFNACLRALRSQQICHTLVMTYEVAATTDITGVLAQVFGNNPSSVAGWSTLAAAYDEYRVLGMRLEFSPTMIHGGTTATYQAPIAVINDYDNAAALTLYTDGAKYDSYKEHTQEASWTQTILMSAAENASFLGTNTPANTYYFKTYSSGNSASVVVGRWTLSYLIQFRGHGI